MGTYAADRPGRHQTGSAQSHASRRSGFLSILARLTTGISGVTRTNRGAHLVPRSDWAARKDANAFGSNVRPGRSSMATRIWSPARGSGTPTTAAAAASANRQRILSTGLAAKFSESTRSQSPDRPANQNTPSASR